MKALYQSSKGICLTAHPPVSFLTCASSQFARVIHIRPLTGMSENRKTGLERSPKRQRLSTSHSSGMRDLSKMLPTESMQEMTLPAMELSTVEETLKRLLLDVAHFIDSSSLNTSERPPGRLPTVLRFTGGWVRDKLLGADSQDIDVAINNMTGLQFGLELQKYLNIAENPRKYGIGSNVQLSAEPIPEGGSKTDPSLSKGSGALGGLHKIEANPEKSKHLETVTTKVLGLDIDLVNLRTETYSEASRNPQMAFGTPEEDALRRDATVNALFYNLSTSSVEDFTGLGLSDMRSEILRTPLEPRQTFLDDPLRVLRLIRFASRLDYSIESNTEEAMDDEIIRSALTSKISRERVGSEMDKMLKGVFAASPVTVSY